ncbi:cysteine-rich receptor-like protein kinase 14 isoform X2 [Nymphaea colorata]|uniref:cysteine-rich receptor-like protein kinase 14 isoform X2 n=1 Tax=Nymphaea colorata TaxID=210225 RepID=UPI00129E0B84|nr:cysteine-rich receptor-like protein kinase 14 isoform X2 [Nymphaea colorata]
MVYPVMVPSLLKVDFYILLLLLLSFNVDHAMSTNDYIDCRCSVTANYTDGSAFEVNMHSLFSILTNDALPTGFSNATVGVGSDTVHSLVQCRGDIDQDSCKECIRNSTQQVVGYCPYNMDAIIWYEKCQLRYSITNFFGQLNVEDYGYWYWINDKMEDAKAFNENLGSLLKIFTYQATTEPSRLMFATSNIPYDDQQTICGLVQCTRDISLAGCSLCLNSTIFKIRGTCENGHGCEVAAGSCRVRFDTELFYGTPTTPTSSLPAPPSNSSPTPSFNSLTPRPSPSFNSLPPSPNPSPPPPSLDSSATSSGASNTTSGQQKSAGRKHMYIIIAISVLTIVVLITCLICGFYWWKTEFCCLWRKKLKRGGLQSKEEEDDGFEQQGEPTKHMQLDWPVRFKLINGIARGVLYLHEDSRLRTVHRDLKASNILLDEDMNPKISDFGNAKIVDTDQTQTETLEIMETRSNKRSTTSVDEHQSFRFSTFSAVDIWHLSIFLREGCQ